LKNVTEGTTGGIEVTGRRRRRRKQLLNDLKETRGYWNFNEEAVARTMWRICLGRRYLPDVMNKYVEGLSDPIEMPVRGTR
jgi:hypothetical protein